MQVLLSLVKHCNQQPVTIYKTNHITTTLVKPTMHLIQIYFHNNYGNHNIFLNLFTLELYHEIYTTLCKVHLLILLLESNLFYEAIIP